METENKRHLVIIGYDPAKIGDNASFVVVDPNSFEKKPMQVSPYRRKRWKCESNRRRGG